MLLMAKYAINIVQKVSPDDHFFLIFVVQDERKYAS